LAPFFAAVFFAPVFFAAVFFFAIAIGCCLPGVCFRAARGSERARGTIPTQIVCVKKATRGIYL
jgi:hypothetical protein